jgi:hypothetical protein
MRLRAICFTAVCTLALLFAGVKGDAQDGGDRKALLEGQQALESRVERLRREQDFLLFEKTVYSSDSKYLLINIAKKRVLLKYKNRLLNSFRFRVSGDFPGTVPAGSLVLTWKRDGKNSGYAFIFGTAFAITWTRSAVPRQGIPVVLLSKKDFMSLYYALEPGALAYLQN